MRRPLAVTVLTVLFVALGVCLSRPDGLGSVRAAFEPRPEFAGGDTIDEVAPGERMTSVLVATAEIPAGEPVGLEKCGVQEWPASDVPSDALTAPDQCEGLTVKNRLFPGDVITSTKLRSDVGHFVPAGMRVYTVAVHTTAAEFRRLKSGDVVDLSVTYKARDARLGLVDKTKTFLQKVEVFATDSVRAEEPEKEAARNATLLVTRQQANLLKLAGRLGTLRAVLRNEEPGT